MASDKQVSFRAMFLALDRKAFGAVHGDPINSPPDISIKVNCHEDELSPFFQVKLTVMAPSSMNQPQDKYSSYSNLYANAITAYSISQITDENLKEVPAQVRRARYFDETALAIKEGKPGILKLTISYDQEDSTHEGLFSDITFEGYVDRETDESLGDKPHIQQAYNALRSRFLQDGEITFYIRNEVIDFKEKFRQLYESMAHEHKHGPLIHQFYKPGSTTAADGSFRTPCLQINQPLPIQDRPNVSTSRTYSHRDFTDFSTRKGYAAIQIMEYEKQEVQNFNSTPASVKFITIPGGGNQKYLGIFYIVQEVGKRLQTGGVVWVTFANHLKDQITTAEWKARVIDPPPWLKSGEVAGIVSRPREPFPNTFTDEQKKIPRDFIRGRLPAGNWEVSTDEMLRDELTKQSYIHVNLRLESSDQTQQRQVNAIHILQRGQKLDPKPLPGAKAAWLHRPMLTHWQARLCNKVQLPDTYTNILGNAAKFLTHLEDQDHQDVIQYLQAVPTRNSIALGIIQGRAGVGKTFVVASVVTAILRADIKKKIIVLAPSNEPCNVAARKIVNEMRKHAETKGLIVMRAHNQAAEKNFVVAYAKIELLKAKIEADKLKTAEELEAEKKRKILVNKKKAQDTEHEAAKKKKALEEMFKNIPRRPSKKVPSGADDIIDFSNEPSHDENAQDDLVMNTILPSLIQRFNDEVVVSEGCFQADGSIDVDRLERDHTLGKAHAGLQLATYLSTFMVPGDRLIHDPRFQEIKQSLAWTILVVAGGLVPDQNAFTDEHKWAYFRILFKRFMVEGEDMESIERTALDIAMKELREYCVSSASVLISTENNIASDIYVSFFIPLDFARENLFIFLDEANKSLLTDFCILPAHFEPSQVFMVGDTKQLQPVVIGPTPLIGFLPELQVSTLSYFLQSAWPSVTIYIQRRSYEGVMDIPTNRFYFAEPVNGAHTRSDEVFYHTKKVIKLIDENFKNFEVQNFPSMYFEVIDSVCVTDPITKSRYNLRIAAVIMNIVEMFVNEGIPPQDQGIVTPYMAQVMVYKYAANQLHLEDLTKGYNRLLIGTADSMEGDERPVMHTDTVVTGELGFVDNKGRMLVMTTRAKHASLTYGNTASIVLKNRREPDLIWMFKAAKSETRRICRDIAPNSPYQYHRFVQDRTLGGSAKHELAPAPKAGKRQRMMEGKGLRGV